MESIKFNFAMTTNDFITQMVLTHWNIVKSDGIPLIGEDFRHSDTTWREDFLDKIVHYPTRGSFCTVKYKSMDMDTAIFRLAVANFPEMMSAKTDFKDFIVFLSSCLSLIDNSTTRDEVSKLIFAVCKFITDHEDDFRAKGCWPSVLKMLSPTTKMDSKEADEHPDKSFEEQFKSQHYEIKTMEKKMKTMENKLKKFKKILSDTCSKVSNLEAIVNALPGRQQSEIDFEMDVFEEKSNSSKTSLTNSGSIESSESSSSEGYSESDIKQFSSSDRSEKSEHFYMPNDDEENYNEI